MADLLRDDFGVQVRWKEERSRTTWENAQMTADLLLPQGIKRVAVVTQAWHMPRAVWSLKRPGLKWWQRRVGLGRDNARLWRMDARIQIDLAVRAVAERGGGARAYPLPYR